MARLTRSPRDDRNDGDDGANSPPPVTARAGPITDEDYRAMGAFRRLMREFLSFSSEGAKEQGVTTTQHQALLAIRTHEGPDPISIGQLAECLLIKNHSAVGLVSRLVERGLVARAPAVSDRRRIELQLTAAGETLLDAVTRRNLGKLGEATDVLASLLTRLRGLPDVE